MSTELTQLIANNDTKLETLIGFTMNTQILITEYSETNQKIIYIAAQSGNLNVLKYLLEHLIFSVDASGDEFNLAFYAAQNPDPSILSYVLDPKHDYFKKFNDGCSELHMAIIKKSFDEMSQILEANPETLIAKNKSGHTPMYWAAYLNFNPTLDFIMNHPSYSPHQSLLSKEVYSGRFKKYKELSQSALNEENFQLSMDYLQKTLIYLELNFRMTQDADFYEREQIEIQFNLAYVLLVAHKEQIHPKKDQYLVLKAAQHIQSCIESLEKKAKQDDAYRLKLIRVYELSAEIYRLLDQHFARHDALICAEQHYLKCKAIDENYRNNLALAIRQASNQRNMERAANEWGLTCKNVPDDGDCFFHAALEQLIALSKIPSHSTASELRAQTVLHLEQHRKDYELLITENTWDEYIYLSKNKNFWADQILMLAFSRIYRSQMLIIDDHNSPPIIFKPQKAKHMLYFGHISNNHFQILLSKPELKAEKSLTELIKTASEDDWIEEQFDEIITAPIAHPSSANTLKKDFSAFNERSGVTDAKTNEQSRSKKSKIQHSLFKTEEELTKFFETEQNDEKTIQKSSSHLL